MELTIALHDVDIALSHPLNLSIISGPRDRRRKIPALACARKSEVTQGNLSKADRYIARVLDLFEFTDRLTTNSYCT